MKHEGYFKQRLKPNANNPREVAFAEQWKVENRERVTGFIMQHLVPGYTKRDAEVAATVVQWLGSNVGMSFIRETIKRCPSIAKELGIKGGCHLGDSTISPEFHRQVKDWFRQMPRKERP
jgi:hypothetical protein